MKTALLIIVGLLIGCSDRAYEECLQSGLDKTTCYNFVHPEHVEAMARRKEFKKCVESNKINPPTCRDILYPYERDVRECLKKYPRSMCVIDAIPYF
jgi:hypothetical protein